MNKIKEEYFVTDTFDFDCPWCGEGKFQIEKDKVTFGKDAESKRLLDEDPCYEHDFGPATIHLVCSNANCNCSTFAIGEYYYREIECQKGLDLVSMDVLTFIPKSFYPTVQLFRIPENIPSEINSEIQRVFSLFWIDLAACGNAIRVLIERFLDNQKIKKTTINNQNRRVYLSLHNRIELFENRHQEYKDLLMSIKWIGNATSHKSDITKDNILHSMGVIEHVFEDVYLGRRKTMVRNAQRIVKSKRPI